MVRVKGPLFRTEAHGTLADTITYRQKGVRAHVMKKATHGDAGTQAQLNQRAHMIDAARLWRMMSEADRSTFAQTYQLPHMAPFAVWNKYIIQRQLITPNWMDPLHQDHNPIISPYLFIHTYEQDGLGHALDISGNNRHLSIAPYTLAQGNRAQAADVEGALTTGLMQDSALFGDLPAFTFTFRYRPDYDQDDKPNHETLFYMWTDAGTTGAYAIAYAESLHFVTGDGAATVNATSFTLFQAGQWIDYVFMFNAADSGRNSIYIDGELDASTTSALANMESNVRTLTVGRTPWGNQAHGLIDNVALYPHATNYFKP